MNDASNHRGLLTSKEMAGIVAAYRHSGLSLQDFAREQGIRPGRLQYWVYQKHRDPKPRRLAQEARADPRVVFQEVKLEEGSAWSASWAAEVSVGRGVNVRFSGTASPAWIGAVVQALQLPC